MTHSRSVSLRAWALGLSLMVALIAVSVLALQAVGLDRSNRAVANAVLRDYAAFAADQFSTVAAERIEQFTRTVLAPVACGPTPATRSAAADNHAAGASCGKPAEVDGFFEANRASGRILFATGSSGEWIRAALAAVPADGSHGFRLLSDERELKLVGYWSGDIPGVNGHVVGFIAPVTILRPLLDDVLQREHLLPASLADASRHRQYLAIDISDRNGLTAYHFGDRHLAFATERPIGGHDTNMHVRLAINEAAATQLIIGGIPQSRLPLVLSLLGVAIGLLAIGAWQMHREHRLARMRVDFVRSASHELRTPLAQIRLFTDTLQLGRVRSWSEVMQSLSFVDQQTRRLSRLVENLLTFANGDRRRRATFESIELASLVSEIVHSFEPLAKAVGQGLHFEAGPPVTVQADREWLTQIILNLLDNASKYGPAGQTISVRVSHDGRGARITIDDQGPGIPWHARQRIFMPFVRLAREHEQRTGGTGIGLAVAADLVAAMNGTIRAEDGDTPGARLVVQLPTADTTDIRHVA